MTLAADPPPVEPLFLDGPAGRLFAIYHAPPSNRPAVGAVVYLPPFAEEMNRARRMAALQARALAACGVGVLLLDLYGTGDSGGEFADTRWHFWLADVAAAADWLARRLPGPLGLWGLRLGGALAAAAVAAEPERFQRLLLWQPVVDGKAMMTQFLRLRVAAAMGGEARENTEQLRADLAAGRPLEVAGYMLAPELVAAIDGVRLDGLDLGTDVAVDWLEVAAEAGRGLTPAARRVAEAWQQRGMAVAAASVAGQQFWSTQEITLAPDLLAETARRLAAGWA
ncbi:MAG TPA: hydrolase 2, exosortase A system-associated [Candidatus Sulfotelmatobacter sp.]|nr:hydrolase 2, exosortase A system-associated [Candidatus Sulfotelmatobacter sp.]